MTDSSQLAVPPPRGWRIPEALSHLPEEELRARFATRELRLRGFKSSKEGLEAVSTEADPLWAAEAELSPKFNIAVGPSLILRRSFWRWGRRSRNVGPRATGFPPKVKQSAIRHHYQCNAGACGRAPPRRHRTGTRLAYTLCQACVRACRGACVARLECADPRRLANAFACTSHDRRRPGRAKPEKAVIRRNPPNPPGHVSPR